MPESQRQKSADILPGPGSYEVNAMTSQHQRATLGVILPEGSREISEGSNIGVGYYDPND